MNNSLKATDRNLDYQEIEKKLVGRVKNSVEEWNWDALVIGVSGWIDSAVVSTLAAKTWLKTVLVTMPIHQAIDQVTRADEHIKKLQETYPNIIHYEDNLTEVYEAWKNTFLQPGRYTDKEAYIALVNYRARLRMANLYNHSGATNGRVIWTWNKVEDYGLWFFTKYGDGWVDYSPIWELLKSEVYKLGAHMWVIKDILEARPTDGLHENGATDEEQIWATYDELEWAMEKHIDFTAELATNWIMHNDPEANQTFLESFEGRAHEVMKIYLNRHIWTSHKMRMPPVASIS